MSMERILILAMNLNSGGAERQTVAIAKALKDQGCDVTVACYSKGDFYLPELENAGINVVWMIEKRYIRRVIRFRKLIRKGRFDAVISLLVTPNIINLLSAIGGKKWKVILGERSAKGEFFKSIKAEFIKVMLGYADTLVCNSENATSIWKNLAPRYSQKIKCIYNLLPQYHPTSGYIPRKYGRVNIVVAASYQPLKNMKRLILAVGKLGELDRCKIHIDWYGQTDVANLGTGPYDESVAMIVKNKLESIISLNPPTKNIYDVMYEADVIALVSEVEGLPNVICEALMLGKPVIMSTVSDYDILVGRNNGYVCNPLDVNSIKSALERIINLNEENLLAYGSNSYKIYQEFFSNESIIDAWIRLIKN